MNWGRITDIARWEFLQKVRGKGFIVSLILTPALILAFGILPSMLASKGPDNAMEVAVVDKTGAIYPELKNLVEESRTLADGQPAYLLVSYLQQGTPTDTAIAKADRDALAETIEGTIIIGDSAGTPQVEYRSPNAGNVSLISVLESGIKQVITRRKLNEAGIDTALYRSINTTVDITTIKISAEGEDESGFLQTFFTAYVGIILFMILILTTGQTLVRSLVEEKSNRIMELLTSSATPQELMWGKLIGLSGLGITQVLAWGALGVAGALAFSVNIDMAVLAPVPYILIYLMLGYFFFSAIFIGVGSLVTTEQEAQLVTQYLTMLLVAPFAFAIAVIQNPNAGYVSVLSYIPFLTPSMMMLRVATRMPAPLELITTMLLMVVATAAVTWVAAKVFRTAILLYGKRPSVREIVKWLKA